jgi:hypothetical protein
VITNLRSGVGRTSCESNMPRAIEDLAASIRISTGAFGACCAGDEARPLRFPVVPYCAADEGRHPLAAKGKAGEWRLLIFHSRGPLFRCRGYETPQGPQPSVVNFDLTAAFCGGGNKYKYIKKNKIVALLPPPCRFVMLMAPEPGRKRRVNIQSPYLN